MSHKLNTQVSTLNALTNEMRTDLRNLEVAQNALFGHVQNALDPRKKGPKGQIKTGHDAVGAALKALEKHIADYRNAVKAFADDGMKEVDKLQQQQASPKGKQPTA